MTEVYFPDINRAAVIVKLKKPFIDWLVYTSKEHDGPGHELKPEEVETEGFDSKHVYLIPAYDETEKYEKFVRKHCTEIFEHELAGWYTDPEMWPKDRSWKVFQEWLDYEIQTIVLDMADKPIEYEE
ncbi:MAG: hypothetical protein ABIH01_05400 [Candidatus Omnitrophota bacterium]